MGGITRQILKGEYLLFLGAIFALGWFFYNLTDILPPFVLAFVMSYLANPIVKRMEKVGFKRSVASVLVTIAMTGIVFSFFFFSVPFVTKKLLMLVKNLRVSNLWVDTDAKIAATVQHLAPSLDKDIKNAITQGAVELLSLVKGSFDSVGDIAISVFKNFGDFAIMLFTPVLMYYTTKDWRKILRDITMLVPRRYLRPFLKAMKDVDRSVFMYLKGQLKVSAILCVVYSVLLYFTKLRFGFILGFMTGIFTVMPYIGFAFMALITIITAFQEFGSNLQPVIEVIVMLSVGQALDVAIITPKFMGESVNLSPIWMIFGVLACGAMFGAVGAFFALPILVVGSALIRNALTMYRNSTFYKETY